MTNEIIYAERNQESFAFLTIHRFNRTDSHWDFSHPAAR